jgi:DNA-binding NarL/FixJ family response regulator
VIRVVIVDDHALVRSGLRLMLDAAEDITVEDEGGTADEAVRLARLHKPDVVLLDVVMPGRSGLDAAAEAERRAEADPLSDREREVLRLLALGHTNQEIAKQLYISVRTAETHRSHIMQKLRLKTRADLVRYALAQGLLEPAS